MKHKDILAFLSKVTKKRIRFSEWRDGRYLIPTGKLNNDGDCFQVWDSNSQIYDYYNLLNGLTPTNLGDYKGVCWILIESPTHMPKWF